MSLAPRAEVVSVGILGDRVPSGAVIRIHKREDVQLARDIAGEMLVFARSRLAKAALPKVIELRDKALALVAIELETAMAAYFTGFLERADLAKAAAVFPLDPDELDWKTEARILAAALRAVYVDLGELAFAGVADELGVDLSFAIEAPATKPVLDRLALQVTQINDRTREILVDRVAIAIDRGYSIEQLVAGQGDLAGLADLFGSRAKTIALTETATAYNTAATAAYKASGLVDEVLVFDGADCGWTSHDDGDLADRSVRTLAEADAQPISHPNCQRAFGAVVAR